MAMTANERELLLALARTVHTLIDLTRMKALRPFEAFAAEPESQTDVGHYASHEFSPRQL